MTHDRWPRHSRPATRDSSLVIRDLEDQSRESRVVSSDSWLVTQVANRELRIASGELASRDSWLRVLSDWLA